MKPGTLVRRTRNSSSCPLRTGDVGIVTCSGKIAPDRVWVQWLRTGVRTMPPLHILEEITDEQL